jgi:hypothetical protein
MMIRVALITLALCVVTSCGQRDSTAPAATASTNSTDSAKTTSAPAEFDALKGKWTRTDGEYLLEIKSVAADGTMDAGYYNPRPIHVSKAMAIKESGGTKIFVELQDEGYPGCTYSLNFDAATTQLHGQYFQAAQQQTYDVVFAKLLE